ncbi:hypothetical protein Prudu_018898 [Prunus dulcis]|uniref:Ankyrin repeat family protein n=1 Tax=Prunus dulcis TaxID=3755 RepID=A0A4Y1RT73_PRUDU|nr:hypothetical protein Prudu_018898 [Prunus dulcis]
METNYNLKDLKDESLAYVNRLFSERYKQWKSDLHHYFEAFDDPQVALQEGCPKELEGREDSWEWLYAHFQAPAFVGNRKKKTFSIIRVPGPSPIGWMHGGRGVQIPRDRHDDGGEEPVGSSRVRLPTSSRYSDRVCGSSTDAGFQILTETLDQTLGRRPGTYCRGMGNARWREPRPRSSAQSNSQVTALTAQVATLQSQMSVILQSLAQPGIPVPHFDASTSEPVHPEHPHQTTAPVDPQTSEPHVPDDNVDFGTLFD